MRPPGFLGNLDFLPNDSEHLIRNKKKVLVADLLWKNKKTQSDIRIITVYL